MPGLVGFISGRPIENGEAVLRSMMQTMLHSPDYASTLHIDHDQGIYLGNVTLESESSRNILTKSYKNEEVVSLLAGECCFDSSVMSHVPPEARSLSNSNIRNVLAAYEEIGDNVFSQINGWFAGIIADKPTGRVILFNDRFGMQKVYYHESEKIFYFSSEAKAILQAVASTRAMDLDAVGEYLNYDCVLHNRSFFKGIKLLPGGSKWVFSNGDYSKGCYFSPEEWEQQEPLEHDTFLDLACSTFEAVVPRYFGGGSVGMALTGGLDTRSVLSARRPVPGDLPCYTFSGMYRNSLDVKVAQRIAEMNGQSHECIRLGPEFLKGYPEYVEQAVYVTDGLANVTMADELYLNSLARKIAPVKITGKFGSQVLRSVNGLRARYPKPGLISPDFDPFTQKAKDTYAQIQMGHPFSFFLFSECPWYWSAFTVAEQSQLTVRSPYLDNDFVRALYRSPKELLKGNIFHENLIRRTSPQLLKVRTDKGMYGASPFLLNSVINSWYKSQTIADKLYTWDRIPFHLTDLVSRIDSYLLKPFHLDARVRGRSFFRHYRTWFRDELSEYVQNILYDPRTLQRPYWNPEFIHRIVQEHNNGWKNHFLEIRKILTIELIHRTLIEKTWQQY